MRRVSRVSALCSVLALAVAVHGCGSDKEPNTSLGVCDTTGDGGGGTSGADAADDAAGTNDAAGMTGDAGTDGGADTDGAGGTGDVADMDGATDASDAAGTDGSASDASDAGQDDGQTMDAGGLPNPPTNLDVVVQDRRATSFKLSWTTPATFRGASPTTYAVRYAKVPITAANFDDPAVTGTVTYSATPRAVGLPDSVIASGLYIETNYYFAMAAVDFAGNRSSIVSTSAAVAAHFLTTTLTGQATSDHIGFDVSGIGDFGRPSGLIFDPDGISDLIVGSAASTHVYIYFGSSTGYAATPSVTITGSTSNFGLGATDIGDVDGDGKDDIGVFSPGEGVAPDAGGKIYIFSRKNPPGSWGTTNSWPANLTSAQANYVISLPTAFKNSAPVRPLTRLGNFDGAGADDFSFSSITQGGGRVYVITGSSTFSSFNLSDTTRSIEIDGPGAAGDYFGSSVLGVGPFFSSAAGTSMIVSATTSSSIYAYGGQATAPSGPDDKILGTAGKKYGSTLGFVGRVSSSIPAVISVGATTGMFVDVFMGTATDGPLLGPFGGTAVPTTHLTNGAGGNSFGVLNFGGGVRGTSSTVSFVGNDMVGDLVVAGQSESGNPIYIVDGATIATMGANVDVSTAGAATTPMSSVIKVVGPIPSSGWGGYATGTPIPDSNGDGAADFAVGEFTATTAGRVVVFY